MAVIMHNFYIDLSDILFVILFYCFGTVWHTLIKTPEMIQVGGNNNSQAFNF